MVAPESDEGNAGACLNKAQSGRPCSAMHELFVTSLPVPATLGNKHNFASCTAPKIQTFQKCLNVGSRLFCIPVNNWQMCVFDLNPQNFPFCHFYKLVFVSLIFQILIANCQISGQPHLSQDSRGKRLQIKTMWFLHYGFFLPSVSAD